MLGKRPVEEDFEQRTTKQVCKENAISPPLSLATKIYHNAGGVSGLIYIPNFLSKKEESDLIQSIDAESWSNVLKRRVQHYGFRYDYKSRSTSMEDKIGDVPNWCQFVIERMQSLKIPQGDENQYLWENPPDQVIVNEYQPGQGISAHIDSTAIFAEPVISISLGSDVGMEFTPVSQTENQNPELILLERRSAVILLGDSRYRFKHAIRNRKSDSNALKISGEPESPSRTKIKITRTRRISLTFRHMILTAIRDK